MDAEFRGKVRSRMPLVGTFIKTAAAEIAEILGLAGLDFAIVDAEHAPFDLGRIDPLILGGRCSGLPCLVRIPANVPALAGQMLDLGAAGVLVPHVSNTAAAAATLAEAKFHRGRRGFSPSTRAAGYGMSAGADYAARADAACMVWCQIEDGEALRHIDELAAMDAIDCLFIGPADLALSLGAKDHTDPVVAQAVQAVARAGEKHGRAIGIFVNDMEEGQRMLALGISVLVCGSDQSHLLRAARSMKASLASGQTTRTSATAGSPSRTGS